MPILDFFSFQNKITHSITCSLVAYHCWTLPITLNIILCLLYKSYECSTFGILSSQLSFCLTSRPTSPHHLLNCKYQLSRLVLLLREDADSSQFANASGQTTELALCPSNVNQRVCIPAIRYMQASLEHTKASWNSSDKIVSGPDIRNYSFQQSCYNCKFWLKLEDVGDNRGRRWRRGHCSDKEAQR